MNNQKIENLELLNNKPYDEIHWWQFPLTELSIKLDKKFMCDFFNKIQSERSKSLIFASYINTQSKKYNKEHKTEINEWKSQNIKCECGGQYTNGHKTRHFRTKYHKLNKK